MNFNIITLGCKVNAYESNFIKESLIENGFSFCDDIKSSDIVILNTCTVTDMADKKCLKTLRRIKRENPKAILVVCGCSTQNKPELYKNEGINILTGSHYKSRIIGYIKDYIKNHKDIFDIDITRDASFDDMMVTSFDKVRAFIKIEDGCDNFCSYCIIPLVRGKERSKDYALVIKEATSLVNNGYQELVLTGINTGAYNSNNHDLTDLIEDLSKIDGLKRIRLSSVEITELNDRFLSLLKNNKVLCDHLHIPLQSGCDKILKIMNRKYDTKYYEEKINLIRSINPDIAITTDVIVGHNYETDEDFLETYEFCKKIEFSKIHAFPYSERRGTKSSMMDESIPENIRRDRCRKLINLSSFLEDKYYQKFIGKEMEVLIESNHDGISEGHTSNYLDVKTSGNLEIGKIYNIKL